MTFSAAHHQGAMDVFWFSLVESSPSVPTLLHNHDHHGHDEVCDLEHKAKVLDLKNPSIIEYKIGV